MTPLVPPKPADHIIRAGLKLQAGFLFPKKIEKGGEKEYDFDMNLTRRKKLLIVWAASIITVGVLVCRATGISEYGWAASLSLLAISLGVPLMRAFTEFSK